MVGIFSFPGQSQSVGYLSYVQISDIRRTKLGPKANRFVFLGRIEDSDACKFLDLSNNSIIEARNA